MTKVRECLVHPVSVKLLKQGHPWVTEDSFSSRFPRNEEFVIAVDDRKRAIALLINDPFHKAIKGRVWSTKFPFDREALHFTASIQARIENAVSKREAMPELKNRDNYYLVFGEADNLPGLFILKLGQHILIQFYTGFWTRYKGILQTTMQEYFPETTDDKIWFQTRGETQASQKLPQNAGVEGQREEFHIQEFGIQYWIRLGGQYDHGLYTDMSNIREKIKPYLNEKTKFLNLFSYTGAFSLWALKNKAEDVVSVDLSPKYIEWLQNNIGLNADLDHTKHQSMVMSVEDALDELHAQGRKFNVILSDPPSSSSDGNKRTSAIKNYKDLMTRMNKVLDVGGVMIVFLNTHQVTAQKFERVILDDLKDLKLNYIVRDRLRLGGDCPTLKGFPEGDYLKGLILEKKA